MTTSKQVRWRCPSCSSGILAPSRPRKNDVRRYCLPCSARSKILVERVPIALEAKRQERRKAQAKAAKRARKHRPFTKTVGYYWINGPGTSILDRLRVVPNHAVRMRITKRAGPSVIRDGLIYIRKGRWADRFDMKAAAFVADAKWSQGALRKEKLTVAYIREYVKELVKPTYLPHPLAGWHPRSLNRLEIELAARLRQNAAVQALADGSTFNESDVVTRSA